MTEMTIWKALKALSMAIAAIGGCIVLGQILGHYFHG